MDARASEDARAAAGPRDAPTQGARRRGDPAARRRLFLLFGLAVVAVAILWGAWQLLVGSRRVSTNDAYVAADSAQVTPLVSGQVVDAPYSDTYPVRKGQVLVVIDPADFRLAVAEDAAALGQAERKVEGYFADSGMDAATVAARAADVERARAQLASAQADLARARTDLARRQALAPVGAVSGDELTAAQNRFRETDDAVAAARSALATALATQAAAAQQQRGAQALVAGTTLADNPEVAAARAKLDQARLDLSRTVLRAPIDGVIARNAVQVGQKVDAGTALMTIVPIEAAYVNANFKESQVRRMRIGQAARLTSDLWGRGVVYHGRVSGFAGGSGSAFALIPAQNATGNWIKVVQRLPVRIDLDPGELRAHPLRVGLSMTVTVDLSAPPRRGGGGATLADHVGG
ncbi:MAG TPA: HlyD family efflux transporter periplasmic adaptor subunit [Caulobacteraceae bacterium]|nr:HlyD family efflux transporter periplasmic adaptor subunit [Caulobacteraceae bacterium]